VEDVEVGLGGTVLYVEHSASTPTELRAVPLDGSRAPLTLNTLGVPEEYIVTRAFVAHGKQLVYSAEAAYDAPAYTGRIRRLFRVPLDGSAAPVVLGGPFVSGGAVFDFTLAARDDALVFAAARDDQTRLDLFRMPATGGAPVLLSSAPAMPV